MEGDEQGKDCRIIRKYSGSNTLGETKNVRQIHNYNNIARDEKMVWNREDWRLEF